MSSGRQVRFRVLGMPEDVAKRELRSWDALDRRFSSLESEEAMSQEPLCAPLQFLPLISCAESIARGNTPRAEEMARQVPLEPMRSLSLGLVRLAQGRYSDVLLELHDCDDRYGQRVSACVSMIMSAAHLGIGMPHAAEKELERTADFRTPVLAFSLSLVPAVSRETIVSLNGKFRLAAAIAQSVGVAGTGLSYPEILAPPKLTNREVEIISLIELGLSDQEISDKSFVSLNTTKSQLQTLRKKLGVRGRKNIVKRVHELRLLD